MDLREAGFGCSALNNEDCVSVACASCTIATATRIASKTAIEQHFDRVTGLCVLLLWALTDLYLHSVKTLLGEATDI